MPKFSAYLRGEGTQGPQGIQGPAGPAGPSQTIFFDVDVTTGKLYMFTDSEVSKIGAEAFSLDDSGHLVISRES